MARTGVPIEQERRTSRMRLDIDCAEQAELVHKIRQITRELEETPSVAPSLSHIALKGIQLTHKDQAPHAYMAIETTEKVGSHPSATISVTETAPRKAHRSFVYRPLLDYWDVYQPESLGSPQPISNSTLISSLSEQLPKGTLDSVLDYMPQGFEVAQLLVGHLRSSARTRTDRQHYQSHGNRVGMNIELDDGTVFDTSEFTRDADLVVARQNNHITQGLFVAASTALDIGTIRKTYGYELKTIPHGLVSAGGTLYLEAPNTIQQSHLDAFARADTVDNEAITSFYTGLDDLRFTYTLPV